jgi:hypothetical protein
MLNFQESRIMQTIERPVASGATVTAEGQALVNDTTGGVAGVKPATGASTELFMGVALSQQLTPLYLPFIERQTVAALAVTCSNTPAAGTIRVYNVTKAAVVTAGAGAGQYGISGAVITIVTGGTTVNTDVLEISYRYSPTTLQVRSIQGDIPPGGAAGLTLNSVGVITQGDVVTTEFDTAVDWTAANPTIKLAANGLFTIGGSGPTVDCKIIKVPASGDAFLGLHFAV